MLSPPCTSITIHDPVKINQLSQLTTTIHDCIEKLVSAFNARACWFLNSKQLDSALIDADAIIGIAPWPPLGYLHAGNIHIIEKRHQAAFNVYDKGLQHVPKDNPSYYHLIQGRYYAYGKLIKCVDFISKLPLDIVMCNNMPRLLRGRTEINVGRKDDFLSEYLRVCRTWRRRISIMDGLTFRIGPWPWRPSQLLDMAPGIKSLILKQRDFDWMTQTWKGFGFVSLKKLCLEVGKADRPKMYSFDSRH